MAVFFPVCLFFAPTDKESRYWNAGQNALNVETAGYAMMAQILLDRTGYAGPIVTYLTNQRKGGMGFVSTQVRIQPTAHFIELLFVCFWFNASLGPSQRFLRFKLTFVSGSCLKFGFIGGIVRLLGFVMVMGPKYCYAIFLWRFFFFFLQIACFYRAGSFQSTPFQLDRPTPAETRYFGVQTKMHFSVFFP